MSEEESARQVDQAPQPAQRLLSGVELKTMAANRGFAVDETTGDRMIQALQGIIDSLEARWSALQQFQQSPKMSTTATSKWVSNLMVNTATDERGLLTQLQQAKAELPTYIEAINLAKSNYRTQDGDSGTALRRAGTVEQP
ncbi:hypothetical protein [Amycolatopsis alkalitolerans]|uniref:Uncharacterized protein n=1 Tax=Amycolatopsis alkalitolerans TaxID=2547244 RepID=A0A5C4M969_9PSEU|nr:hypothetical protein [Amycolatopsis alkalitolerans]TNC29676.1 hypothetical protein FG385_01600 [Amycolatopsis alkalitolerans]